MSGSTTCWMVGGATCHLKPRPEMAKKGDQNKEEKKSIEANHEQVVFPARSGQGLRVLTWTPELRRAALGTSSKKHLQRLIWSVSEQQEPAEDGYSEQRSLKCLKPLLARCCLEILNQRNWKLAQKWRPRSAPVVPFSQARPSAAALLL